MTAATRVWDRLMALAAIGATPTGGVNCQAVTPDRSPLPLERL